MLRVGLRWKILLLTALPLLALAAATLWFVDRGVSARSQEDLTDDLRRAADLFENMLSASAAELSVTGAVIVRDPRFFSVLALPHGRHDREFLATVAGVAQDFQQLAHPDVFEIVDSRGDVMASVGRMTMAAIGRDTLVSRRSPAVRRSAPCRSAARRCCSWARRWWRTTASSARCCSGAR
jgi:hypothetical protein